MKKESLSSQLCKILFILCSLSLFVVCGEIINFNHKQNRLTEIAKNQASQEAKKAVRQLEEKLQKQKATVNYIAQILTEQKLEEKELLALLKQELEKNPDYLEVGVAYQPFAYKSNQRLYAPYYTRKTGKTEQDRIGNYYDYTKPNNKWFYDTLEKGSLWNDPVYYENSERFVSDYLVAFHKLESQSQKKSPVGVAYANLSLEKINELIKDLDVGKSGYVLLLSRKGEFLATPQQEYVKNRETIYNLAKQRQNPQLLNIAEKVREGKRASVEFLDEITGKSSWVFLEPISLNGWTLALVAIKEDSAINLDVRRQQLIRIALETVLFLFLLSIILFRGYEGNTKNLWRISISLGVFCFSGIGFIWYLVLSEENYKDDRNLLLNSADVQNLLIPQFKLAKSLAKSPPLLIPTGVFIQNVKFDSANDVLVTGYVWQKYTKGLHDDVERGFYLPEGYEVEINQIYRTNNENTEIIGWHFEATLRQNFVFTKYPFDYNDVWVRIWPTFFTKKNTKFSSVIFTPDFNSYEVLNPTSKPGLEEDFVSAEWNIESSFFEYKFRNYNTTFGLGTYQDNRKYPELYFTVILKRDFLGILIARIIPITVVAILLFIILLLSKDGGLEVIGACAGFIFVIILDQINLRGLVAAKGIIYFEYFYFVTYILILVVAVNSILLHRDKKVPLIEYENNLIVKLVYWPSFLSILLLITAFVFY